jgi:TPR repeat protein
VADALGPHLAADCGIAAAQHKLGVMYTNGLGVAEDVDEGERWLALAAVQGYVADETDRQHTNQTSAALHYFRPAAAQGHLEAQFIKYARRKRASDYTTR